MRALKGWLLAILLFCLSFGQSFLHTTTASAAGPTISVQAKQYDGELWCNNSIVFALTGTGENTLSSQYTLKEGQCVLQRAGESDTQYAKAVLKTTSIQSNGGLVVRISHTELGYAFTAGDVFIIGGVWSGELNTLNIEPFQFVYGDSITESVVMPIEAASDENTFNMMTGAQMRLDEVTGLRFAAQIGETLPEDATFFMLIFPEIYLSALEKKDDYYREIQEKIGGFVANIEATPFQATAKDVAQSGNVLQKGYYYVRGSLIDIRYDNLNVNFFAIAYYIDGEGTYHYASFEQNENGRYNNSRSIAAVAAAALQDGAGEKTWSEEEQALLEDYVAAAEAKKKGISEEDYYKK